MNTTEFYRSYAQAYGKTICSSKEYCCEMFEHLAKCVMEEDRVLIKGFGVFKKKKKPARIAGDFGKNGGHFVVPERYVIVFKPSFLGEEEDDEETEENE